ncbi:hypothetical protein [Endozoicomonas numazuensis]|uniref:Uncharacterized protein n=1 Tax=Endozoicomonas numazuensis TaxID=1137799 RepID=A0A081N6J7_9GAMM|nr:hypothetical protein [Endozoicomonas numazuensis]KEQ14070.1 hypothetical protein GZ78_25910 [Endozoicomonas numazuensis]
MTASASPVNASDFLNQKAADIKSWYESGTQPIEGLNVRKMPARVEPLDFIPKQGKNKNKARFKLIVSKNFKLWSMDLEISFFCQPWLSNDGIANPPGLLFSVIDDEEKVHAIEYLPIVFNYEEDAMDAQQWFSFWVQKFLKRPSIKIVFAYKQLLSSELED